MTQKVDPNCRDLQSPLTSIQDKAIKLLQLNYETLQAKTQAAIPDRPQKKILKLTFRLGHPHTLDRPSPHQVPLPLKI